MKTFASIFAAAVLAGLGGFFLFNWRRAFTLLDNTVVVEVTVFVAFIAALTVAAAALGVLFRLAIARSDHNLVAKLESRIRALEQGPESQSPPTPSPVD